MSPTIKSAPTTARADRSGPRIDTDAPRSARGRPVNAPQRRFALEGIGLAAAVLITLVTYGLLLIHPWPHSPLNEFLKMFARGNADIWPMQLVWYATGAVIVGLALWPQGARRRSTQLICLFGAAYLAWEGIAFFAVLYRGMNFAWFWAAVFIAETILFLIAGFVRRDLLIAPRWDVASALGWLFIAYALVAYPLICVLGGHALSTVPIFGLSPCATVIFFFGLLLLARPPVPTYLLPFLLAWALGAAPPDLGRGLVADAGMVVAGVTTAIVVLWRNRMSSARTVLAGAALALMIGWSGHEDVLMCLAGALVVFTLAQALRGTMPNAQVRTARFPP